MVFDFRSQDKDLFKSMVFDFRSQSEDLDNHKVDKKDH